MESKPIANLRNIRLGHMLQYATGFAQRAAAGFVKHERVDAAAFIGSASHISTIVIPRNALLMLHSQR